ncbi:MAG: hypothetical protein ABH952_05470 [Candidatus Omnitrophota bacterium]
MFFQKYANKFIGVGIGMFLGTILNFLYFIPAINNPLPGALSIVCFILAIFVETAHNVIGLLFPVQSTLQGYLATALYYGVAGLILSILVKRSLCKGKQLLIYVFFFIVIQTVLFLFFVNLLAKRVIYQTFGSG